MLTPAQVVPFLQHDDPIVRRHALNYFHSSYDFGPLTADHYWAVIDRLGENDETLGCASQLSDVPQTDASLHRLVMALASNASENFEFHYQHAARDMDLAVLARNRDELLGCPTLLPHVRTHLELRLSLLDQSAETAWERLMDVGNKLGDAYAMSFNTSESNALIEASARGGPLVCELAMKMLGDESARQDWREIFAVKVLGQAKYEPAIDALIEKFAIDADVLREEVSHSLSRIGTQHVIEQILTFYPGKPWHVRLYADAPLRNIKRPESEAGFLKLLDVELAIEANPDNDDEGDPLTDQVLNSLADLCSLAGLEESRRIIADDPEHPEILGICEGLLATAVMLGVTLPEEQLWRSRVKKQNDRMAERRRSFSINPMADALRKSWRETGISMPHQSDRDDSIGWKERLSARLPAATHYDPHERLEPIRNTTAKVGRNDPCPCGSGKKYKKCCGK